MSEMPDLSKNTYCFYIDPSQNHGDEGYIPSVVVEGELGHFPLCGKGDSVSPWRWGNTLEAAQAMCVKANADRGIDEEKVLEIVSSSIQDSGSKI